MAVVQAPEEPLINFRFRMAGSHFLCHSCVRPLRPPIFKGEAGHAVCCDCRGRHFGECTGPGAYVPCTLLDKIVSNLEAPCANEAYGCESWVVYYEATDHQRSCRFAPCMCPDLGCGHTTSPARLVDHFSTDHAWRVTEIDYAKVCKLAVPGLQEKQVLVGKEDGSVFLMFPSALGHGVALSLVCVRACGDAAAGVQQYLCKAWAQVAAKDNLTLTTFVVTSSDLAGGFVATDQHMYLAMPPALLQDESGERAPLMVRIDKVSVAAASATPPSSRLPVKMIAN